MKLRLAGMVLAALLIWPPNALGVRSGGHNPPTRKLEAAFKVIGGIRAASRTGCYGKPRRLAGSITRWAHPDADVAPDFDSIRRRNVVYVISRRTVCGRVTMGLRARGRTYVLNTAGGEVFVLGRKTPEVSEDQSGGLGPLRELEVASRDYRFTKPNKAQRLEVACPDGKFPLGGGMTVGPGLSADGEGVYPQSYERLGVQRGYHITAIGIDPSPDRTEPRRVSIQAVCGRGLVPASSPHKTVFVRRNSTGTAIVWCPDDQYLFAGGFQRTNFSTPWLTFGGNFATESRAIGPRAWRVSGAAAGYDNGELTAIAYCATSDVPLITEVSATAPLERGGEAMATTPRCPPGQVMASGGFSFGGARQAYFAGGAVDLREGTWSAAGFGYHVADPEPSAYGVWPSADFGYLGESPHLLTAYGYCLRLGS